MRQEIRLEIMAGGGVARTGVPRRGWGSAHGCLLFNECSSACQAFWVVLGVKWLILLGWDGCERVSSSH
jgi:hypothetical protein